MKYTIEMGSGTIIQGVSEIHGITSGMSSACVNNKNSLNLHSSGNALFPS
jgi:hypothetical protein